MSRLAIGTWIASTLTILLVLAALALAGATSGHRRPPWPRGALLRLEARPVHHPMDRIVVTAVERDGPAILVETSADEPGCTRLAAYRFPGGAFLGAEDEPRTAHGVERPSGAFFDFDGDGTQDSIEIPGRTDYGLVRVRAGGRDQVLFEDRDPIEYECADRAFALPDLDGDGCSELALVHPRMDRSRYDLELWDRFLGVRSWITIVSGREASR